MSDEERVNVDEVDWAELAYDEIASVHRDRTTSAQIAVTYALLDIGQQLRQIRELLEERAE